MIFQSEVNECGLACLAMISSYCGKKIDIGSLRGIFRLPPTGASVRHLIAASEAIDMQARALKLNLQDIGQLTLPVILHWDFDHFVVLKKISQHHITIHDPAVGIRKYTKAELSARFTGVAIELHPRSTFEQEDVAVSFSLRQLFKATPNFYKSISQVFLLSLLIQMLALLSPLYFQLVIDQGLAKGDMDLIFLVAVLFFFVMLAKTMTAYFRGVMLLQFSNQLGFQLISNTFSHLLRLPLAFFERREMGDIVSRFTSLENIKQLLTQEMVTAVVDGIFSLITLVLLFMYSPLLAAIAIGFVSVFVLIRLLTISVEKARRQESLVAGAKHQSRFMENIRSIAVTKNYAIEHQRLGEWQNLYAEYVNTAYHLSHFQLSVHSVQSLLFGLDHIVTIYLGSLMVYTGELTIGQLLSFIFLKQHFTSSIVAMLPKLAEIKLMKLELDRVSDIVLAKEETKSASNTLLERKINGNFEVQELSFSYSDEEPPIIHKLSFSIESGDCIAITGKSGCGKSTLLKLMLGLETPQSGHVLLDGLRLQDFGSCTFRTQVAAILHNDVLLCGTLAYNINLEVDAYNEERLKKACLRAGIYEVICALPMGFNTRIGEMGAILSAGEAQRVLLARALFRLPKILVMDEALSHVGDDLAYKIVTELKLIGITIISVTHNPVLLELATHRVHLN
ncbi:MAG: ABC transporter ATP-binding protein [SAR86 cluster bacterium]|uniref:ABC transporter ATP-binding protein n=1 Tax=SAR86 cluster bacterium TaxID=2030880 RepID=A0A2A5B1K6_9GAMM|nr:MAG: ABC transporter ATP-binding protein [SAR86 cluster bacterium]